MPAAYRPVRSWRGRFPGKGLVLGWGAANGWRWFGSGRADAAWSATRVRGARSPARGGAGRAERSAGAAGQGGNREDGAARVCDRLRGGTERSAGGGGGGRGP